MNYHIEIFLFWIAVVAFLVSLCFAGKKLTKRYAPRAWWTEYRTNQYLNDGVEENINLGWFIIFIILFFLSVKPIYPTMFSSVPTVQITKDGDIIPLPYGAWKIPKDNTYTRLRETVFCDIQLKGRTDDGIYIGIPGWFLFDDFEFKIVNYAEFYHQYKTKGVTGFCEDVNTIIVNKVWIGKTILPDSQENIEAADQKILALQQRLLTEIPPLLPVKVRFVK